MKKLNKKIVDAILDYQVPGCVNDFNKDNIIQDGVGVEWSKHIAGTIVMPGVGTVFLGLPKGFNRLGIYNGHNKQQMKINIFENWKQLIKLFSGYDKFNVPVWKYKNEKGHVFVRGLIPRLNHPFLHIILEDCLDKIDCYEVTKKDIKFMD